MVDVSVLVDDVCAADIVGRESSLRLCVEVSVLSYSDVFTHHVWHPYSAFQELYANVSADRHFAKSVLPDMPVRGHVWERVRPKFRAERTAHLRRLLNAMLLLDPHLSCEKLREFLGLSHEALTGSSNIDLDVRREGNCDNPLSKAQSDNAGSSDSTA